MVGTIARPDLLGSQRIPELARAAYRTLHERLLLLPDEVMVYPTHGGGSFCATGAGDQRVTSIGQERRHNPLIQATTYRQFLARYLQLVPCPAYYDRMRTLNRRGASLLGRALPALRPLLVEQVEAVLRVGTALLDVRPFAAHDEAHVPGSLNAGIEGAPSAWVGWVLPPETPLVLLGAATTNARRSVSYCGLGTTTCWARWRAGSRPGRRRAAACAAPRG